MFPDIEILNFSFRWYTFWQWSAIIVTICFGLWYLRHKRMVEIHYFNFLLLYLIIVLLGYGGAKLFSFLDHWTSAGANNDFTLSAFLSGNLRWYGALLIVVLSMPLLRKIFKLDVRSYFDFLVLKLCLFAAIVKQACFFSGDGCYGIYTNSIFGMYFHYGAAPSILPVHPTPLYDSIFHLLFFIFLYKWNDRKEYDGQTAIFFFVGTSLFNFALEFIRRNPEVALGLTLSQLTYSLIFFISIFYYLNIRSVSFIPKLSKA